MARKPKASHYSVRITVQGIGEFPIDMCRYDNCVPYSQADVSMIANPRDGVREGGHVIKLTRYVPAGCDPLPTIDRWRSFGWHVMSCVCEGVELCKPR
jgi:hypothetical protein